MARRKCPATPSLSNSADRSDASVRTRSRVRHVSTSGAAASPNAGTSAAVTEGRSDVASTRARAGMEQPVDRGDRAGRHRQRGADPSGRRLRVRRDDLGDGHGTPHERDDGNGDVGDEHHTGSMRHDERVLSAVRRTVRVQRRIADEHPSRDVDCGGHDEHDRQRARREPNDASREVRRGQRERGAQRERGDANGGAHVEHRQGRNDEGQRDQPGADHTWRPPPERRLRPRRRPQPPR